MVLSAKVTLAEVRANLDASRAAILTNLRAGKTDQNRPLRLTSLAAGADLFTRSIAWTQQDDQELRSLFVRVTDATAGRVVTVTLIVDDGEGGAGDTKFLGDLAFTKSVTTVIGTADARLDVRTTTGSRVKLVKGVRYRLVVENTTGATTTGIVVAGAQCRAVRRGGRGGIPLVPFAFRPGGNLDLENLNADFAALRSSHNGSVDARYTYGVEFFDLSGMTDTDNAILRQVYLNAQAATRPYEVIYMELVGGDVDAASTWTVSMVGVSTFPTMSIDGAGAGVEVFDDNNVPFLVDGTADVVLQVAASTGTGKKINAGYLVVHTRADRNKQNTTPATLAAQAFTSKTATGTGPFSAAVAAIAAAVAADLANSEDLRCEVFVARTLIAGTTRTWRVQGGADRKLAFMRGYVCGQAAGAGQKVTFTADASTFDVLGAGAGAKATGTLAVGITKGTDPTNAADDVVVSIAAATVNAGLAVLVLFWT